LTEGSYDPRHYSALGAIGSDWMIGSALGLIAAMLMIGAASFETKRSGRGELLPGLNL
jgi:hypothetical protein